LARTVLKLLELKILTDNSDLSRALLLSESACVLALIVHGDGSNQELVDFAFAFKVKAVVALLQFLAILVPGDLGTFGGYFDLQNSRFALLDLKVNQFADKFKTWF
jgi:hypothetical protein